MSYSQNDPTISSFIVEWYDANAGQVKEFTFQYYSDGQIEMNDRKTGSKFVRKCPYVVDPNDLYIGSTITVLNRQLNIVDYGDTRTRETCEIIRGRTFGVVTPQGYNQLGEILIAVSEAGLIVSQLKMLKLNAGEVADFRRICGSNCGGEEFQNISSWSERDDAIVAMELVDNSDNICAETWKSEVKRINNHYGKQMAYAADAATAQEEAAFIFNHDKDSRPSPSVYDYCTLAVIRPEAVQRGCSGKIIDDILQKGYEICGVEMYVLTSQTADDFFKPYKNILINYQDMINNMTSGRCIALCLRPRQGR
jgi:nucleoside-diphosphate kinase